MTAPSINVYPADFGGCGFYRVAWAAQALAAQGAPVRIIYPDAPDDDQIQATWLTTESSRKLVSVKRPDCDIVVLQRPLTDTLAASIPILQAQGVRVVVEIDDNFEAISPRNVSWRAVQPTLHPRRNSRWLRVACDAADLVVVSTPALANVYGRHGRVVVVPNRVPAWYLALEREAHDGVFVGWSGSVDTHPDDLQVTGGGVARALRATGARFAVVGTGRGVGKRLGIGADPPAVGWVPITEYPRALAELDIGIVPLELSPFNEAKSALKLMEMAAVGVVPVVSPTAENVRLAQDVGALVADRPKMWEGMLKRLVMDDEWRAERAAAVREGMRRHTIEAHAEEWLDAWRSAVNTPCAA